MRRELVPICHDRSTRNETKRYHMDEGTTARIPTRGWWSDPFSCHANFSWFGPSCLHAMQCTHDPFSSHQHAPRLEGERHGTHSAHVIGFRFMLDLLRNERAGPIAVWDRFPITRWLVGWLVGLRFVSSPQRALLTTTRDLQDHVDR